MDDQIITEMVQAHEAIEALKAKEAAERQQQVAVQTPEEIGDEQKPVVQ